MLETNLPTVDILGVSVSPLNVVQLHQRIAGYIAQNLQARILHVNIHGLNLAVKHRWLRDFFNAAELVFCDGAGVVFGAWLLGHYLPKRITYADWIWQLAEFAEPREYTFFFVGAKPGLAEKAAEKLRQRFPDLKILATRHGYFDKSPQSAENQALLADINAYHPHILLIGMGMPLQEKWLMENWDSLQVNVVLTGGAVFDYVSGDLQRAPKWMTDNGLEWLGRLFIEPGRLWKRYVVGNPLFLWRVLKQRLGLLPLPIQVL